MMAQSPGSLQLTAFLFSLVIAGTSGCRTHGAEGIPFDFQHKIDYESLAADASAVKSGEVEIHESVGHHPDTIRFSKIDSNGKGAVVAPGYAHRVLGVIKLHEHVDVHTQYLDELYAAWNTDALRVRREKLVLEEAARHGANNVYLLQSLHEGAGATPDRTIFYLAVQLSSEPPHYPEVNTLLGELNLNKDGYQEVKRFTAKLQDLPSRPPESIKLERGHCYMLAIAFHPEAIDRPRNQVTPIEFAIKVPNPEAMPGISELSPGRGSFGERMENGEQHSTSEFLDGIWSRVGAGQLACPVYRTQTAQVSFMTTYGSAMKNRPAFAPGRGTAEFVVYDHPLAVDDFNRQSCGRCEDKVRQCRNRGASLGACAELTQCLQATGMTLKVCAERFQ